ncbi:hypothetical protein [Haloferax gibbonsii]|uniref:hypothetical protein n=1 Tax=Haloferax gibbonsii TaxID=35746 RepID=UPI001267D9ED|nr:hypothetical protein [Haloferax gibbonsii]
MPFIESAAIAIAVEAGSRGWEWIRDSSAEANAPLIAAQEVADETAVTTTELRTAFERATEDESPKEIAYKQRETFINTVAAELDAENSVDIVRLYLDRLSTSQSILG